MSEEKKDCRECGAGKHEVRILEMKTLEGAADICGQLDRIPGVHGVAHEMGIDERGSLGEKGPFVVKAEFFGKEVSRFYLNWDISKEQIEVMEKRCKEKADMWDNDPGCLECMENIKRWAMGEVKYIQKLTDELVDLKTVDRIIVWWIRETCYGRDHSRDDCVDPGKVEV